MGKPIKVKVTRSAGREGFIIYYKDPVTGKRHQRTVKAAKQSDALKAAGEWEADLLSGRYKPQADVSWDEFVERFMEDCESKALKTASSYRTAFNAFARCVKIEKLSQVGAEHSKAAAAKWKGEGLKPETIRGYLRHLQAALNWAVENELLNQQVKLKGAPRREKGESYSKGRPISGEEFERMLSKIEAGIIAFSDSQYRDRAKHRKYKNPRAAEKYRETRIERAKQQVPQFRRLLLGIWYSGLRLAEFVDLSWDSPRRHRVDFSDRRPMLRMGSHQKSGKESNRPITPDFAELLLQTPAEERKGFVFPLGENRSESRIGRIIAKIGEVAGVVVSRDSGKFASAHDLRRTFGTRWATRVMPPVLQELMGHADIKTTMRYYVGSGSQAIADAVWDAGKSVSTFVSIEEKQAPDCDSSESKNGHFSGVSK